MAKTKKKKSASGRETDTIYILKLVLYLILGAQWFRITKGSVTIPLPLGLLVGLFFARTEKIAFDRKMAYAILLLSMFIGFWLPIGLELTL